MISVRGRPAAPGVACGPIVELEPTPAPSSPRGDVSTEASALETARERARTELTALMRRVSPSERALLEFQLDALADAALSEPVFARIASGVGASQAWSAVLDEQIADFKAATDEVYRSRASDFADIRDRVLRCLAGATPPAALTGAIFVATDFTPSRFLETDWSRGGGLVLREGSAASHVAMLARARGVPMVVAVGDISIGQHVRALVDGNAAEIVLSPTDAEVHQRMSRPKPAPGPTSTSDQLDRPARTADGRTIRVAINVGDFRELAEIPPQGCDGIGLLRTEFLFPPQTTLPDEETQYAAYCRILRWAEGRPVRVRTFDFGGDKPHPAIDTTKETNPALGLRGIRRSLREPDVFRVQLRALARAAMHGPLQVMFPMITQPVEFDRAGQLFADVVQDLTRDGIAAQVPALGIMVEVPAVALCPELFPRAAFLSIGTNDLVQYLNAAARDDARVAALCDPGHPALEKILTSLAQYGREKGIDVSVCGDLAGDPTFLPLLLRAGITALSVAPNALRPIKTAIPTYRA
jgi:phosphoenolpyruvate-protein phosphotransferase (PTS system enzyme I)